MADAVSRALRGENGGVGESNRAEELRMDLGVRPERASQCAVGQGTGGQRG